MTTPTNTPTAAALALLLIAVALPAAASEAKLVVAHRGASGYLPEHTLEAKAMAYGMGADCVEQDTVLSKDGVPVVLHDIHIDTVTDAARVFPGRARPDGRYYAIDFTLPELKRLNVLERSDAETGEAVYPGRFPRGLSSFAIPTLAEELELVRGLNASTGRDVCVYTEIKAPAWHREQGQDASRAVIDVLAAHGYADKDDNFYLQTFDWNDARRIRGELGFRGKLVQLLTTNDSGEAPGVDYDYLRSPEGVAAMAEVADGVGPAITQVVTGLDERRRPVLTDLVENAHAHGLAVHPYTLRADSLPDWANGFEETMRVLLFEAGADGVFTDFPDRAVAFLAREAARTRDGYTD